MKICVGASSGGHMNELMSLLSSDNGKRIKPDFFVTTDSISQKKLSRDYEKVYVIGECNRVTLFKIPFIILRALITAWKEKPDVVLTTGSFPLAIFSRWAKLFGAKVIWIDSIANIEHLTASGQWCLKFADRVYTQWPELAANNDKLHYEGYLL